MQSDKSKYHSLVFGVLGDSLFTEDNFNRDKFEKAWIDVRGEVRRIA